MAGPMQQPEVFLDLTAEGLYPDGAVIDAEGVMWLAQWGASRVAAYDAMASSCGPLLSMRRKPPARPLLVRSFRAMIVTSARKNLGAEALQAAPLSGATFVVEGVAKGAT